MHEKGCTEMTGMEWYSIPAAKDRESEAIRSIMFAHRLLKSCKSFKDENLDLAYVRAVEWMVTLARTSSGLMDVRGMIDLRPDIKFILDEKRRGSWKVCVTVGMEDEHRTVVTSIRLSKNTATICFEGGEFSFRFGLDLEKEYADFMASNPDEPSEGVKWFCRVPVREIKYVVPAPKPVDPAWKEMKRGEEYDRRYRS